jgi:hypothetical protein
VLLERRGVLEKYYGIWHPPQYQEGKFVFFCRDMVRGRLERIAITPTFHVETSEIGPDKKFGLK